MARLIPLLLSILLSAQLSAGELSPWESAAFADSAVLLDSPLDEVRLKSEAGDLTAIRAMGIYYARQENEDAAHWYFELGVALNDPESLMYFANSSRVPPDERLRYLVAAAEQGFPPAEYNLAAEYWNGILVPQDISLARELFLASASAGFVPAASNVGLMLVAGIGGVQEIEQGIQFLRFAADHGDERALFNLGVQHLRGRGVDRSDEDAARLFTKAAELGHGPAHGALGALYMWGINGEPNLSEAERWLVRGVEMGDATAEFQLARLYIDRGMRPEARHLLERAAHSNYEPAVRLLEEMLATSEPHN